MFFFFFQAEDGIRDGHVTGVQTCALPISIAGNGFLNLGSKNLAVGSNNTSTTFSGVIRDGGLGGGAGGSLTKVGTGALTLSGANTYIGGTAISNGTLVVNNFNALGNGNFDLFDRTF